ncbi:unnamed protein product, partial [Protopolystoma xenopodis]
RQRRQARLAHASPDSSSTRPEPEPESDSARRRVAKPAVEGRLGRLAGWPKRGSRSEEAGKRAKAGGAESREDGRRLFWGYRSAGETKTRRPARPSEAVRTGLRSSLSPISPGLLSTVATMSAMTTRNDASPTQQVAGRVGQTGGEAETGIGRTASQKSTSVKVAFEAGRVRLSTEWPFDKVDGLYAMFVRRVM